MVKRECAQINARDGFELASLCMIKKTCESIQMCSFKLSLNNWVLYVFTRREVHDLPLDRDNLKMQCKLEAKSKCNKH